MRGILEKGRMFAVGMAAFAAALLLIPAASMAQESQTTEITVVTDLYKLESLLPEMSSGELGTIKDIAAWCLDMAQYFKDRLADARKQVDLQRGDEKGRDQGARSAGEVGRQAKDEAAKKALAAEVKAQKAELDILDALKDMTTQEDATLRRFRSGGQDP